ncbi:MAG: proliferating cell nuclear antigen (pcna) [archaeon]
MAIELKDALLWQKSVNAISSFISEGNFRFNDKGISFRALDPSQIVLVNYFVEKKVFDKFEIEPTYIGVDISELAKIMNRAMLGDRLVMDVNDSEISMRLEGDLSRNFKLPLIDVSDEEVRLPETKFDARIEIPGKVLKEALKDASLFGSSVTLRVKGSHLTIEARGTHGNLKTTADQSKKVTVKASGEIVSKYSLNFLQNIVKEADSEKIVTMELKSDAPMKVSYDIGPSKVQYFLAHMII